VHTALLLYKILHLLFFPLVRILCALWLESKKNINMILTQGLRNLFLRLRGYLTNPFRTLLLCFGVTGQHQVLFPIIILLKILSASIIVIMSWQDVTRSSLCSMSRSVEQNVHLSLSQILLQNSKNYSLGDVQRFCYHSWCDSTVIFDQINSNNAYLSSSRFWTVTSRLLTAPFRLKIKNTN
jgi:hypothetical protein